MSVNVTMFHTTVGESIDLHRDTAHFIYLTYIDLISKS